MTGDALQHLAILDILSQGSAARGWSHISRSAKDRDVCDQSGRSPAVVRAGNHCRKTPWRGLSVLLGAMQYVKTPNVTLDVYSSTKIYGEEFHKENEHLYKPLFDQAEYLKNVNYIGYKPHEYILERITDYQMWTHPSVFEETFGIGALEAMSSGLYLITTNFGALFETCSEWPIYVNYTNNLQALAERFAHAIDMACASLHEDYVQQHIEEQQKFAKRFYSWDKKGKEWETFLKGALDERQSTRL